MALVDGRQSRFLRREFIKSVLAGAAAGAASGTIWGKAARADSAVFLPIVPLHIVLLYIGLSHLEIVD